jgi:hypothetical protein
MLLRSNRFDRAEQPLRESHEETRRLRKEKARSPQKSRDLKPRLDCSQPSPRVSGGDSRAAAAMGVPYSKVSFRQSPTPT